MSIISSICAKHHRGVVEKAVALAKPKLEPYRELLGDEAYKDILETLDGIYQYCSRNISE